MKQADLQRLYDTNEAAYQQSLVDHDPKDGPPPEKDHVKVRFGKVAGFVVTYSGETPPRYLVRLEKRVPDPDNPDFGPALSRWIPADELEAR